MAIELSTILWAALPAILHFILAIFVRPKVTPETWDALGPVGKALDVSMGNYGATKPAVSRSQLDERLP